MNVISSKDNEIVKSVRKLREKKYRDLENAYIVEGVKMVKEAILEKASIRQIIICDDCEKSDSIPKELMYEIAKYDCMYVTSKVFKYISEVQTPQGVLAVIEKNNKTFNNDYLESNYLDINYNEDIIVALDDIQDPGNLGTILRTVDSVGLTQILVSKGTADCYNPKVVRSSMGAIYRVKVIECKDLLETLKEVKKNKFKILVTSLGDSSKNIYDMKYNKKILVIGNEANGVEEKILNIADEKIKIPMLGRTESLNAAVATGIVLYEYVRQKLGK